MCCRYNRGVRGGDGAAPRSSHQPLLVHHTNRLRDMVRQEVDHRISLQLTLSSVVRAGNRWTEVCIESVLDENVER